MTRAAALKAAATRRAKLPPITHVDPGQLADYARVTDAALLDVLRAEQLELERFTDQYQRGQWSRLQDNGTTVSGCSRTGGRGKRFAQLAEGRLHRIETELSRRGFDDEQVRDYRHGDVYTLHERQGIQSDEGDTTFHFSEAV